MMKGGLGQVMRQAQKMQENMQKVQEKLADIDVEGEAGAGMVKVVLSCRNVVRRVSIDASLMTDDKDLLEDLIATACNDALRKAEAASQEKMSAYTAGLNLPPGFKLPF
jgi:DNA-binding YbaB/EbfC family protein